MYNIIIFGTGRSSEHVINLLNKECSIVAFVDNNMNNWGKKEENVVVGPEKIKEMNYDYIIIASQYNNEIYNQLIEIGIERNKILQFYKLLDMQENYLEKSIKLFNANEKQYEIIATGISYCNLGLKEDELEKECLKLAFGSQDLYYDYNLFKFMFNKYNHKLRNVKYNIIGLCYYSFQYDMSLSAMKDKCCLYYDLIGLTHHNANAKELSLDNDINKNIADKIFKKKNNGEYDLEFRSMKPIVQKSKEELGYEQALRDCNKNYPKTVEENIEILKEYLFLLKENNIEPIIVIFPASKYYTKYFSERIENEFRSIINEIGKLYDFQYIDYFRSELFTDDDFVDVSHLNGDGAEKFTKILNNLIKW